ncbi:MAG: TolC family protein [Cyclobacteriaceae bacterium]|nr:TolC family protein [Cyclobacteriaceae bacterium]
MTVRSFFFVFLLVSIHATAQDSLRTLTFEESIQIALTNSTAVLKGMNAVEQTGAQVLAAHGQFLPDAVLGGTYSYTGGNNLLTVTAPTLVNSQRTNINYQIVSSINIYNGYANRSALKAALLTKEIAELSLTRAQQQIRLDITQAYLQVVLDKEIVAFAEQNFQTSQKRENQLTELVNVGRRPKSDLYQQQSQTSLDQQFLTNSINKLNIDRILLLQRLRLDPSKTYEFSGMIIDESPLNDAFTNEQTLIRLAQEQRVDLKSSQRNQEAAIWNIRRSKSGYLPRVSMSAGAYGVAANFSKLYIGNVNSLPADQRSFGTQLGDQLYGIMALNVGWNIFDKYTTKSNVAYARVNANNARIDYENVNLQIVSEIRQALGNYRTALQQTETSEKGLIAATQAFETLNGRYSVGAANFIELSNAQNNLLLAKQNRAQAAISLFLQKKVIDFYLGN